MTDSTNANANDKQKDVNKKGNRKKLPSCLVI